MVAWLPVLKAVIPHLSNILSAAVPVFNARRDEDRFTELQTAVRQNTESIRTLAEQMQRTIKALEAGAGSGEQALKHARLISLASLAVALIALGIALAALWAK